MLDSLRPRVIPTGIFSALEGQGSPIFNAVLCVHARILPPGPFPKPRPTTRAVQARTARVRVANGPRGQRSANSRTPPPALAPPLREGDRRRGRAERGGVQAPGSERRRRRVRSGPEKWKKPGRWRRGDKTRTVHAGSRQELTRRKERGRIGKRGVPKMRRRRTEGSGPGSLEPRGRGSQTTGGRSRAEPSPNYLRYFRPGCPCPGGRCSSISPTPPGPRSTAR